MKGEGGQGERGRNREGKREGEGCYLDSIGRLFESDQHIPVSSAGRIPGSKLRESGWGTGGRTGRARGKHGGELRGREGAPSGPAVPPPSTAHAAATPPRRPPHTDRLLHTACGRSPGPGRDRLAAHARPRGGGGGPRARQLPQSGPRHVRLAAPGRAPRHPCRPRAAGPGSTPGLGQSVPS